MKAEFFNIIIKLMAENKDIYFVSAGLGWPRTDELAKKYPDRFIQCEAAEQTAADICVGLSLAGKIPIMYTITPFYYRAFETIRTYINHEKLHVIMAGAGRNNDYSKDHGFSHNATDIQYFLFHLENIKEYYPNNKSELPDLIEEMIKNKKPVFLSLKRN